MIAKTVREDQAQQVYCVLYHPSLQKSASLPRTLLKSRCAPKPFYDVFPVSIQERFVSHLSLNHKSIPTSKKLFNAYARGRE